MNDPNASPYPSPGETIDGKYRLEKLLGEGGMGAVARATHLLLHRTVAVKFMNPQFMSFPGAVERFLNEGRASGAIRSEHVVPVSDVGCLSTGTPYLVMECLYGLDLADLLARDGPSGLPTERAVHFVLQILRGLQAAHAIGIIHRDMKPSNCFVVNHDGEDDFVKILDFGISKIAQPGSASLTQTNSALGTPLYMSPEQARSPRDVDARSDLYSVGVILYELLCGHTPFFSESGEFTEILFQLFTADPPPIKTTRPDLPDELAAVVHKALSREVPDRYISALDFAENLLPFANEGSHEIVEKMRGYQPPSMTSVAPMEGLPTSLVAFSQLQKKSTDVMVNRPTTDVQAGPPVTAMLQADRMAPPKNVTAVLQQPPAKSPSMRSVTGHDLSEEAQVAAQAGQASSVKTDLGASRDMPAVAPEATRPRSPLIYALPVFGLLAIVGILFIVLSGKSGAAKNTNPPDGEQARTAVTAIPTATTTTAPSETAATTPTVTGVPTTSATPSAVVSASTSGSASGSAASGTATPTAKPTGPRYEGNTPGHVLNSGLHN